MVRKEIRTGRQNKKEKKSRLKREERVREGEETVGHSQNKKSSKCQPATHRKAVKVSYTEIKKGKTT